MSNKKNRGFRNDIGPVDESFMEEVPVSEEDTFVEEAEHDKPTEPIYGFVNCPRLNIRKEPTAELDNVVGVVTKNTEVLIDTITPNDEWIHVCTSAGIEGYCMKEFITYITTKL